MEEIPHIQDVESVWAGLSRSPGTVWLDSVDGQYPELGRYSVLATRPRSVIEARGRGITIRSGRSERHLRSDPFDALAAWHASFGQHPSSALPFAGGAIGYLGYELGGHVECLPTPRPGGLGLPDLWFGYYDSALVIDHAEQRTWQVALEGASAESLHEAVAFPGAVSESSGRRIREGILRESLTADAYHRAVERALEYIAAGDIFQVNLARRLDFELDTRGGAPFRRLRRFNGGPFTACLDLGDERWIWSTSPERFLATDGRRVETRPIKGTVPREADAAADARARERLLASAKDAAELTMIVDLERNDLGRVCEYGSIRVETARRLESFPTVHHLEAQVTGFLRAEVGLAELLRATFPGGSITGAPKVRAMEIIHELEPVPREAYTGAIGYLGADGRLDLNIAIRTVMASRGHGAFHVGSGIVADSDPESEWSETEAKGRGLARALLGETPAEAIAFEASSE